MANNKITMRYNVRKERNSKSKSFGKFFGVADRLSTLSTRGLAQHMHEHNCPYGLDTIVGVLTRLSSCVPELVAQGVGVKLDGIGTFYPTLKNKTGGSDTVKDFTADLIEGVRVRFTPDGSALDNITSRVFREKVQLEKSNVVVLTGSRLDKTLRKTLIPVEDWIKDNEGSTGGNNGGTSGGGNDNQGGGDDQPIVNP